MKSGMSPPSVALTEHAIRPEDTAAEQRRLYALDVEKLLQRKQDFVGVPCPACDAAERTHAFSKYECDFSRCEACRTIYLAQRPTPAILDDYYRTSENYRYWNEVIFPRSESVRKGRIFAPRLERLLHHVPKGGELLEVGPGFGTFAEMAQASRAFRSVTVVEPTPSLANTCRERGLVVIEEPIERAADLAKWRGKFDVICAFEVIEHLFRPRDFVAAARCMLAEHGHLVLTCPNGDGFDVAELGALSPAVDLEHLNLFNPESLAALLRREGFTIKAIETPGRLDADIVRNRALAKEHVLTSSLLRRLLLDEWDTHGEAFQNFLVQQRLSSNLWMVACKS